MSNILYRLFSESGELIYVGTTLSFISRIAMHRRDSFWFHKVSKVTMEKFPTIEGAQEAEKIAIRTECPRENVQHMPNDLFKAKGAEKRAIYPTSQVHPQIDGLCKEYRLSRYRLGEYLDGGIRRMNEILMNGSDFDDDEVDFLKRKLGTTYRRLAKAGMHKSQDEKEKQK